MNANRFEFSSVHDESLIRSLAHFFGTRSDNGVFEIPSLFGKGHITRKELENGLVLVCWDFSLNADVTFIKRKTVLPDEGRSLIINYLIEGDDIILESHAFKKKFTLRGGLNILLLPDDKELEFHISAGTKIKVASISVRPGWLKKEYEGQDIPITEHLHKILFAEEPSVYMESATMDEVRMLSTVIDHLKEAGSCPAVVKPRVMTVLADFFTRIATKPYFEITESRVLHFAKMQEVETMLRAYMEKELPDIETIARSVALSVSTLKRHFKISYQKGVYEYYLEMKMEYAKRLLMETDVSVNEVAYRLNYEKASSFIDSFKKIHGYSPGVLRKKAS